MDDLNEITFQDVATLPRPGIDTISNITFCPNGESFCFLRSTYEDKLSLKLFSMNIKDLNNNNNNTIQLEALPPFDGGNTETNLSLEEKLRRERQRNLNTGITSYSYHPFIESNEKMFSLKGDIYIQKESKESLILYYDHTSILGKNASGIIDPQYAPNGKWIAFVQNNELYMIPTYHSIDNTDHINHINQLIQLTNGSSIENGITNGISCYLTQEELNRYRGYWWSPNSDYIIFEQVNSSFIPIIHITHTENNDNTNNELYEKHRYPFTSGPNPRRKLGIIPIQINVNKSIPDVIWCPIDTNFSNINSSFYHEWNENEKLVYNKEYYIVKLYWLKDNQSIIIIKTDRFQRNIYCYYYNLINNNFILLLHEETNIWINASNYQFRILKYTNHLNENTNIHSMNQHTISFQFLWLSERSGFFHLYLYEWDSKNNNKTINNTITNEATLLNQLTGGEWMVENIEGITFNSFDNSTITANSKDNNNNYNNNEIIIYFTGTYDSPLERHLYMIQLTEMNITKDIQLNNKLKRFTKNGYYHSIIMDSKCNYYINLQSSLNDPPFVTIHKIEYINNTINSIQIGTIEQDTNIKYQIKKIKIKPEIFHFNVSNNNSIYNQNSKKNITLYGALYIPDKNKYGKGPFKTLLCIYGGPHAQLITDNWSLVNDMRAQHLCEKGYCVVKIDNRGSARRGLEFESYLRNNMGTNEINDQITGLQYLINERKLVLKESIGVYGWSYGGYLSLLCLMKAYDKNTNEKIFKLAIAGAPVTCWNYYDTCYTERYMLIPKFNKDGYYHSNVMNFVKNLDNTKQKLLLIHGLIDENVHFKHTSRFINKMIKEKKVYDLLIFPNERHSPRSIDDRIYMEERIYDYIYKYL